jgi:hypothetical protein
VEGERRMKRGLSAAVSLLLLTLVLLPLAAPPVSCGRDRVVVKDYYADPFGVDLSPMPSLSSLPVDDPRDGTDWQEVPLPRPCVNGDGGSTYIKVSRGSPDKLLIYLEGGGAGTDYLTYLTMALKDPTDFPLLAGGATRGIFDRRDERNPFRDYTFILVPYSTADVHSGNRVMRYYHPLRPSQSRVVYHVGFVNAAVAIRWAARELPQAGRVVITGSSAGGYGTLLSTWVARLTFGKPVVAISDAGPALVSKRNPNFTLQTTEYCWGWLQNLSRLPEEEWVKEEAVRLIREKGEPLYGVLAFAEKYEDCLWALYEDQMDLVIGTVFLGYSPKEFREVLLGATGEIRSSHPSLFYRFLPYGLTHTIFFCDWFYTREINGVTVCDWVAGLLEGRGGDLVEPFSPWVMKDFMLWVTSMGQAELCSLLSLSPAR